MVRMYDGSGNPLGRAFTRTELHTMFRDFGLKVIHTERYYFPRRAFGPIGRILSPIHPLLAKRFGLMITIIARKEP